MFFEEEFVSDLSSCSKNKNTRGIYLSLKMYHVLKTLRKSMKTSSTILQNNCEQAVWLKENFSRLEQAVKEDINMLYRLRKLEGDGKYPCFYTVFKNTLCKQMVKSEKHIEEIFSLCNNFGQGLDYNNCLSLPVLFRVAVEIRLCETFVLFLQGENENHSNEISELFSLLDILLDISSETVLKTNKIEKTLLSEKSRIYERLTEETKASYRKNLAKTANRKKISQLQAARQIIQKADEQHIGEELADKADMGYSYLFVLLFFTIVFVILLLLISPVFLLFIIPIYFSTGLVLDKFFGKYLIKPYVLPQIKLEEVPEKSGVMTVITTLLFGEKEDKKIFDSLEKSYISCCGENVYFGLLADLPDSDSKKTTQDEIILENANFQIRNLREKYGNVFYLFVRDRQWSNSEEAFISPERKRGAVCSLAEFLCGKSDDFAMPSIKPVKEVCENIKYILTLDGDTNLGFDCVKELVGIGIHPQNEPVFDKEKGVVTKGFGIIQPQVSTTIDSAAKNYFTKIMCGHAGIDNYNFGSSDKNMSLFGQSFFCGKGLIEKNVFYNAFCGKNQLKRQSVLSHDAVEGAIIRCAFASSVCFSDSYPSQMLSYFKRKHRWQRGDFQNAPFLFSRIKGENGKERIVKHSFFSKFFILQNIVNAILPILCLSMLLYSPFCEQGTRGFVITIALSNLILPFVNAVLSVPFFSLWQNLRRIFYSKDLYTGIWTSFMQMLFSISALPKSAIVSLDALVRVAYRKLISHKKLLEWTTFSQSDTDAKDGLLGYVKNNLFCALCGTYLFVLTDNGVLKIVSLMWFFCPYFAYRFSKQNKTYHELAAKEYQTLKCYCRDMWSFFDDNVSKETHFLPPDNIAFLPKTKQADYTSPTNIGFYILCLFVARKMGFIDSKLLEERLMNTLEAVESLPKYKGLLYNWYNVNEAKPLEPWYVSSVDIGNYLACLISSKGALCEFADEMKNAKVIEKRLTCLINVDILPLYDKKKNQFYIGATHRDDKLILDKNHYDMLMSEARILSFVSVANKSIPVYHFRYLSRPFVESRRHIGLASWSGTAFEYFLPEIFIKSKEGTLLYEALSFSYNSAKKSMVKTEHGNVFGISESLYNEFDDNDNYKYFAFGTAKNAMRVTDEKKIISPYSAFLFLPMSRKEGMKNLYNLKKLGCYGKYGFYDSIDFENHGVVKSVMSHHIGMSMCAAANESYDGIIRKWFAMDKQMQSCLELVDEKLPYEMRIKKLSRKVYDFKIAKPNEVKITECTKEANQEKCQKNYLSVGEKLSCVANKNSILKTIFSETDIEILKEKIVVADYDLIENAQCFYNEDNVFVYNGTYKGNKYSAVVYCHAQKPLKIIRVRSKYPPEFTFEFGNNLSGKIGAGAVFAKGKNSLCFCFGFSKSEEGIMGADYLINEKNKVYFSQKSIKANEYVFCIGSCNSLEDMAELQRYIWDNYRKIENETKLFYESLVIDTEEVPEQIKQTMHFPKDNRITRLFCNTSAKERLTLLIFSVFTEYGCDRETVLAALEKQYNEPFQNLLSCLLFSLYVNYKNDFSVGEESIKNRTAYRLFLEKLFQTFSVLKGDEKYAEPCRLYEEFFAKTCTNLSDMRMAQKILEYM